MSPVNCPTCKLTAGPATYTAVQRCPRCFGPLPQPAAVAPSPPVADSPPAR